MNALLARLDAIGLAGFVVVTFLTMAQAVAALAGATPIA
jgi:hypothetical protein